MRIRAAHQEWQALFRCPRMAGGFLRPFLNRKRAAPLPVAVLRSSTHFTTDFAHRKLSMNVPRMVFEIIRNRGVEKSKSRLSHRARKSRKPRGITTFPQPRLLLVNYETGHIVCLENRTF